MMIIWGRPPNNALESLPRSFSQPGQRDQCWGQGCEDLCQSPELLAITKATPVALWSLQDFSPMLGGPVVLDLNLSVCQVHTSWPQNLHSPSLNFIRIVLASFSYFDGGKSTSVWSYFGKIILRSVQVFYFFSIWTKDLLFSTQEKRKLGNNTFFGSH